MQLSPESEVKRLLNRALTVPLVLAVVLVVITLAFANNFRINQNGVQHSGEILEQVQILKAYASDAQTDFRAYWLSDNDELSRSSLTNQEQFADKLPQVALLCSDNPEQTLRVGNIGDSFRKWQGFRQAELAQHIGLAERERQFPAFYRESRSLLEETMRTCDDFIAHERALRDDRVDHARTIAVRFVILIGIMITILVAMVFFNGIGTVGKVARIYAQALKDTERLLHARDEFLSIASHELKTPLTLLKLQLQLMERELAGKNVAQAKEHSESFAMSLRQVDSLNALIDDLLDTSRIQAGKLSMQTSTVDLSDIVVEVMRRFAEPLRVAGCELKLDLQKNLVGHWDPRRLEQIVANLVANAIKYAPGKPVSITTKRHGLFVCLEVEDAGPGVPEELRTAIFERFERGAAAKTVGGLGLGLFIVKNIVLSKGGKIWVESGSGQGAKFVVELPIETAETILGTIDQALYQ